MIGYAVLDLETTGLRTSWGDRVIEVGVVHLDPGGEVTGEWSTLVNPERDLGPQHVHGITAADIRHAPTFLEIAGELTGLLEGRVPVAHNLRFDLNFLQYEYDRIGIPTLPTRHLGICTMTEAATYLPYAPRNLAGCCAVADIPLNGHHDALIDARAAAGLLKHYLAKAGSAWHPALRDAAALRWPAPPMRDAAWVRRGVSAERDGHFLARLLDRLPRAPEPAQADAYLALLDQVLLDHHISATEADALVELANDLGLGRADVERLHHDYLAALGAAARADGVVTERERREISLVAELLGLPPGTAAEALAASAGAVARRPRFELNPGDLVVFTGEMDGGRESWEERARHASYVPHPYVTKKVRLVIAADPDTLSGKARKARTYGIPIITPTAFAGMLDRAR
ncbi:exonuclease domain-containing protein [Acrocarpospora catenulata]|uniref:exonuclease domain-containing protein n=1 Tax=Acrocarpospora catenulata TaxID=2836182 RepID=UPI001BD91F26|nr:exonuclease domain-containing protein [Acrocarpospora catenulata]